MSIDLSLSAIATIHTDFKEKFGIPRQGRLVEELEGIITFLPPYRNPQALKGLDNYSHLWLIWGFSQVPKETEFHATVRPPALNGNERMGVFSTRSPFRPNPIGLTSVKLLGIDLDCHEGPKIHVSGIDMADNSPIYDIKPYLPQIDCRLDASGGLPVKRPFPKLTVVIPKELSGILPSSKEAALLKVLSIDPRPALARESSGRRFGFPFAGHEVRFTVEDEILTVLSIEPI